MKTDYSTGLKQKRLFYETHRQVAASNEERMKQLEIGRLEHALADSRNFPSAYPVLAKHGYMERTPDGFKMIDPDAVIRRCRELIAKLSA